MKIAMIAGNGGSGGLVAYLRGMLSVKSEHEILFFCTESLKQRLGTVAENIQVYATPSAKERGIEILLNKPMHAQIVQAVHTFSPDVVLFMNGWVRRGFEEYPNVMILHNQLYVDNAALRQTLTKKLFTSLMSFRHIVRRSMKKADGVIFLSEKSMQDAQKNGVKFKNATVVHFGIPLDDFADTISEKSEKSVYKLLYVSSFFGYKHHDALLEAVSVLKHKGYNLEMHFIGAGPAFREQQLAEKVRQLALENEVVFHGSQSHDKVVAAMDAADIFVYPSAVESTGLGVMEAMARGMCIACSNMSCMPEILRDAGVYFNPKRPQQIADAVEKFLTDVQLRKSLSDKAFDYAGAYTWDKAVTGTCAFLETFL